LLYGQAIKRYRRRKLMRVKPVIRLGTEPAFRETLQALGFSGRVNTAFIERVAPPHPTQCRSASAPHVGDSLATPAFGSSFILVACVLSFRTAARLAVRGGSRASGRDPAEKTKVPAMHTSHGGWANDAPLDHPAPSRLPSATAPSLSSLGNRQPGSSPLLRRAGVGNTPSKDVTVLEFHRPVFQGEEAKMSPKMASQRLDE
jgi:hypothetical protein